MNLAQLRALRNKKNDEMKKILDGVSQRGESGLSGDEATKYDELEKEFDDLTRQIDRLVKQEERESQLDTPSSTAVRGGGAEDPKADTESRDALDGLLVYARTGNLPANARAITVGGGKGGAYIIPEAYASSILSDLESESPFRKFATVIKTNGTYNMPIGGSTPVFEWIGEGGTYPKPDTSFTNKTIDAHKAGGIILVSEELLDDESFNLATHLRTQIVEGLAIIESGAFYTGDGTGKPKGMSTDITLTETVTVLDTITLTDVEDTFLAVPAKARKNGKWAISDKFYKAIFRMKDSTGNYIMREGSDGNPGTIFGRPFEIDDALEGGAGEPLAFFGKLEDYVIGDRGEMAIQRLDQTYAEEGYVGFKVYKRTDGKLSRTKYVAQLKNAAA